jgi:hypothetical protein
LNRFRIGPGDTRGRRPHSRWGRRDRERRIRLVLDDDPDDDRDHDNDSLDHDPVDRERALRQLPLAVPLSLRRANGAASWGAAPELVRPYSPL